MPKLQNLSASQWTRLLLASLGLTIFLLAICLFLAAILNAAGDSVGQRTFSAFNLGLAAFLALESIALIAVIAVRIEFPSEG